MQLLFFFICGGGGFEIEAQSSLQALDINNSLIDEACHMRRLCNGYRTSRDGCFVGVPELSVI